MGQDRTIRAPERPDGPQSGFSPYNPSAPTIPPGEETTPVRMPLLADPELNHLLHTVTDLWGGGGSGGGLLDCFMPFATDTGASLDAQMFPIGLPGLETEEERMRREEEEEEAQKRLERKHHEQQQQPGGTPSAGGSGTTP